MPTSTDSKIAQIIRVNHAGEFGARQIYKGQLAVFKNNKEIKHMYEQELEHLKYFEEMIVKRRVRPTLLQPLWAVGGFMLGYVTAKMGIKAAMACTVAVEEVIGKHYYEQAKYLQNNKAEKNLLQHIVKFRDEELEHRDTGIEHGAEQTPGYNGLSTAIKTVSKLAIFIAKRI